MPQRVHIRKRSLFFRVTALIVLVAFICSPVTGFAQGLMWMPAPGVRVAVSPSFVPPTIKGLTIHQDNPLLFDFIIDQGDKPLPANEKEEEYRRLIKYFLAALTLPEEDTWVNLSPYEKDRIIADNFGKTEMGRDLLAQDYILKQLTSSIIYPEDELGKAFWEKVYKLAYERFGTTDIPMNTFNKVWIIPDEAVVYESGNTAMVLKSHLKVMLEEDYLSLQANKSNESLGTDKVAEVDVKKTSTVSSEVVREIVLPEIEKEVNEGKNFALLRQIYSSMILATWYKKALKESLLGQVYADKGKVMGVDQKDAEANQKIYQQYLEAFKKGAYNYIKEDYDKYTNETIPRKYFSGGFGARQEIRQSDGTVNVIGLSETVLSVEKSGTISSEGQAMLSSFENDVSRGTVKLESAVVALEESEKAADAQRANYSVDRAMVSQERDIPTVIQMLDIFAVMQSPEDQLAFAELGHNTYQTKIAEAAVPAPFLTGTENAEQREKIIKDNIAPFDAIKDQLELFSIRNHRELTNALADITPGELTAARLEELQATYKTRPMDILEDLIAKVQADDRSGYVDADIQALEKQANAAWARGQSTERRKRAVFRPWVLLSPSEADKDLIMLDAFLPEFLNKLKERVESRYTPEQRAELNRGIDDVVEKAKAVAIANENPLTARQADAIKKSAQIVMEIFSSKKRKDGDRPYFIHQIGVALKGLENFQFDDVTTGLINLFHHDDREDIPDAFTAYKNYIRMKITMDEDPGAQLQRKIQVNSLLLAVRLLSKLEPEKFKDKNEDELLVEYFRRLADPRPAYEPQADAVWYTDGLIHDTQLVKLSDILFNVGDMGALFANGRLSSLEAAEAEKIKGFPAKTYRKVFMAMDYFVAPTEFLSGQEKLKFFDKLEEAMTGYIAENEAKGDDYAPLVQASREALNTLTEYRSKVDFTKERKSDQTVAENESDVVVASPSGYSVHATAIELESGEASNASSIEPESGEASDASSVEPASGEASDASSAETGSEQAMLSSGLRQVEFGDKFSVVDDHGETIQVKIFENRGVGIKDETLGKYLVHGYEGPVSKKESFYLYDRFLINHQKDSPLHFEEIRNGDIFNLRRGILRQLLKDQISGVNDGKFILDDDFYVMASIARVKSVKMDGDALIAKVDTDDGVEELIIDLKQLQKVADDNRKRTRRMLATEEKVNTIALTLNEEEILINKRPGDTGFDQLLKEKIEAIVEETMTAAEYEQLQRLIKVTAKNVNITFGKKKPGVKIELDVGSDVIVSNAGRYYISAIAENLASPKYVEEGADRGNWVDVSYDEDGWGYEPWEVPAASKPTSQVLFEGLTDKDASFLWRVAEELNKEKFSIGGKEVKVLAYVRHNYPDNVRSSRLLLHIKSGAANTRKNLQTLTKAVTDVVESIQTNYSPDDNLNEENDPADRWKTGVDDGEDAAMLSNIPDVSKIAISFNGYSYSIAHNGVDENFDGDIFNQLSVPIFEKLINDIKGMQTDDDSLKIAADALLKKHTVWGTEWRNVNFGIVLRELLMNALRATSENKQSPKRVEIKTQVEEGRLIIDVVDDGIGLTEVDKKKIFDRGVTTKEYGGNNVGKGLAYSRKLIKVAFGRGSSIEAFDNKQDLGGSQGATFRVSIPLRSMTASGKERISAAEVGWFKQRAGFYFTKYKDQILHYGIFVGASVFIAAVIAAYKYEESDGAGSVEIKQPAGAEMNQSVDEDGLTPERLSQEIFGDASMADKFLLVKRTRSFLSFESDPIRRANDENSFNSGLDISPQSGQLIALIKTDLKPLSKDYILNKGDVIKVVLPETRTNQFKIWQNEKAVKPGAMLDLDTAPVGGIDFNSANLNLQIKRDGAGVPLPIASQDMFNINIDGLIPVILNISPVTNLPLLLGSAETQNAPQQLSMK